MLVTNMTAEAVAPGGSTTGHKLPIGPLRGSNRKPCWGVRVRAVKVAAQGRLEVTVSWMAMRLLGSSLAVVCILHYTHAACDTGKQSFHATKH